MHLSTSDTFEVQRTNNFEVQITGLPGGEGAMLNLTLSVQSFNIPGETSNPIELPFGNSKVKAAGATEWDDGELVVRDFIGADTEKIILDWRKQVYDPRTDIIGRTSAYKKMAFLRQFSPDGAVVRTWQIIGLWPQSRPSVTMDNEAQDKKIINLTLAYDKAYRID